MHYLHHVCKNNAYRGDISVRPHGWIYMEWTLRYWKPHKACTSEFHVIDNKNNVAKALTFELMAPLVPLTIVTNSIQSKPVCTNISDIINAVLIPNDELHRTHVENLCSPVRISLFLSYYFMNYIWIRILCVHMYPILDGEK